MPFRSCLKTLLFGTIQAAALGVAAGLWCAWREVNPEGYLGNGCWRTALWIASRNSSIGAALVAAAGCLLTLSLLCRRRAPSSEAVPPETATAVVPVSDLPGLVRLVTLFALAAALTVVCIPADGPAVAGVGYRLAVVTVLLLVWIGTREAALAPRASADRGSLEAVWLPLVFIPYTIGLGHLWGSFAHGWWTVLGASAGLLFALAAYSHLRPLAQTVCNRLTHGRSLTRLAPGRWAGVGVLGCGLALWASSAIVAAQVRAQAATRLNVIVIAVDTLREDKVSWRDGSEHDRDLTPNLRRLLRPHGTVYTRACSQAPWTMPSFASVFTGLYPEQHGADQKEGQLLPRKTTLAEIVREAGYETMAVVSGPYVSSEAGMLQGFSFWDESQASRGTAITSSQVTDRALTFLQTRGQRPFFLFAHYFDPHYMYLDHPEFDFAPSRLTTLRPGDARVLLKWTPGRLGVAQDLYDEEIAYTDLQLGRVLTYLDEHDLWSSTLVIFVADHGEEFLDHGSAGHAHTLFQELIHVPLLVADPSRAAPAIRDDPVETRWLFGTILGVLGITPPGGIVSGNDLFETARKRPVVRSALRLDDRVRSSLIDGDLKLIANRVTGATMLFDLSEDPGETRDLSGERPENLRRLLEGLDTMEAEIGRTAETSERPRLSDEQRRRLENLGYL